MPLGDMLLFMPSEEEIEWLAHEIGPRHQHVDVQSLYASMPWSQQQQRIHQAAIATPMFTRKSSARHSLADCI
ncbi:hypothetical protein F5X97DRAFT_107151 [Nemania serpens]|nr:hypothetical protein F5X97DRAFT_107151 [Nemania serpens]